jgi:hypothetical protein
VGAIDRLCLAGVGMIAGFWRWKESYRILRDEQGKSSTRFGS